MRQVSVDEKRGLTVDCIQLRLMWQCESMSGVGLHLDGHLRKLVDGEMLSERDKKH